MRRVFLIVFTLFFTEILYGQSTTFQALITGSWTSSFNWSNGIPDENTDVTIDGALTFNCTVNGNGKCHDLIHTNYSTLNINQDVTLTIWGNLFLGDLSTLINNGTIVLHGDYFYNGKKRIESNGSIQINSSIETN